MMHLQEIVEQSGVGFGTSGARGLVEALSPNVCSAYVQAFIAVMRQEFSVSRIAIGIDLRPSSPAIALACSDAIQQAGCHVDYLGPLPTPALAFYAQTESIPAIMVTGSHIPFDRNGLKFYRPEGEITKADEAAMLASAISAESQHRSTQLPSINLDGVERFVNRYVSFFGDNALQGFRLGLYEHSSVTRDCFKTILTRLGAEVTSLGRTDVFIPIDTEAVSDEDCARGRDWAATYHFDAIISTDGDGDRPLIGDEQGEWLRGDIVGLLCASAINAKALAVPVSCNTAIELSGRFDHVSRTRIGSPYVIAEMQQLADLGKTAIAGFEANGGFLLGSEIMQDSRIQDSRILAPLPTRDSVLPVVALLSACKQKQCSLSSLVSQLPKRVTFSGRVQAFPTQKSKSYIQAWATDPNTFIQLLPLEFGAVVSQNDVDGLRLNCENGDIVHLRPSGNAPEFRCYAESDTSERSQSIVQHVLALFEQLK